MYLLKNPFHFLKFILFWSTVMFNVAEKDFGGKTGQVIVKLNSIIYKLL